MIEQFTLIKPNRTGVFIDGSNLLWAMKQKDPDGMKVNYDICSKKLKQFLDARHTPIFCNYYVCEDNISTREPYLTRAVKQKSFFKKLETFGYHVIRKDLKILKGNKTKCDTDVEIVLDLHKFADNIDTMVLFSGDSDFRAAVESFHGQGKEIKIYAFQNFLSWELKEFAIKNARCSYTLLDDLKEQLIRDVRE